MLGERLRFLRERSGLSQAQLAALIGEGYSQSMVSTLETNDEVNWRWRIAIKVCDILRTNMGYLAGHTDYDGPAQPIHTSGSEMFASTQAEVFEEGVALDIPLQEWMDYMGFDPDLSSIRPVKGHSMHPTIPEGSWILVDQRQKQLRTGSIYMFQRGEISIIKRVEIRNERLWLISDGVGSPDMAYDPETFPIVGRVRWMGRSLR